MSLELSQIRTCTSGTMATFFEAPQYFRTGPDRDKSGQNCTKLASAKFHKKVSRTTEQKKFRI
jgi:hypothetical protein